ncbi:1-acyl-sn-glycerol-3-phosphate acyltransferase [bacterium]|nr:1-acyl-sn-glycerol-3-phosphate acyltransferase [bacterium]
MFYWFIWGLARFFFFLRARLVVTGQDKIPQTGPVILVANHISGFDPIVVGLSVSKRRLRFMAKAELFRFFLFNWFLRRMGAYPVKREEVSKEFLKKILSILRTNQALLIFGEGTRNRSSEPLLPLKMGFAYLAEMAPAAVVPVFISGSKSITSKQFRPTVYVQYGDLIPAGPKQTVYHAVETALLQFAYPKE